MPLGDTALLAGAGILAGTIGAAGGITSLVSYPALLAVGLAPLAANVTHAVALVASWPGSAAGSREELRGRARWLVRWAPLVAVGAAIGVVLLLCLPSDVFARAVPFLLAFASLVLLGQPKLAAWRQRRAGRDDKLLLPVGLFAISVYSGYFGAGTGIMTLALLMLTVESHLPRANALKNALLGVGDATAAVSFVFFGPVRWSAAVPLAAGLLVGSSIGPAVTRRVPAGALRVAVACAGLGLAIRLWVVPA
jgi:uncharacterized membrane protein YfcA